MKHFRLDFLPWGISDSYWLVIESGELPGEFLDQFQLSPIGEQMFARKCGQDWASHWQAIEKAMEKLSFSNTVLAAIVPEAELPPLKDIQYELRPLHYLSTIARHAWLGDALTKDRIVSFLQPVIDRRGKYFGYEAFARALNEDGSHVSGAEIIHASREIKIEYRIDRFLHGKAIEAMVRGDYTGTLFVNFLPGFIQKPGVYLEGLAREAQNHGLVPQRIALDLTEAEIPQNYNHLQNIRDYCTQKGYHISLDNIFSPELAEKMIGDLRPSYLKLDRELTQNAATPKGEMIVQRIVEIAHANGATVIAGGVETAETHEHLKQLNVDLFQGYHIGRPTQAVLKK